MNDEERYLVTGVEDGWIEVDAETWHRYCVIKGIDEHPLKTKIKKFFNWLFNRNERR